MRNPEIDANLEGGSPASLDRTTERETAMALNGVLRPGYIQIRVTDLDAALKHYVERVGLHEVSRESDGRVYPAGLG
jgi:hypothetical protein